MSIEQRLNAIERQAERSDKLKADASGSRVFDHQKFAECYRRMMGRMRGNPHVYAEAKALAKRMIDGSTTLREQHDER